MVNDLIYQYHELIIEASLNPDKYLKKPGLLSRHKNPYYDYGSINRLATRIYKTFGESVLNQALNDALEAVREVGGDDAYNKLFFAINTGCITYYP